MVWGAVAGMAAAQLIGAFWYSRMFLGGPWMRATFPGKSWQQIADMQRDSFHVEFVICILSQVALVMAIHYVIG